MELRAWQATAIESVLRAAEAGQSPVCLQAVTGSGKSQVAIELINRWRNKGVVVYTNRRLLFDQLGRVFDLQGVTHGKRAAGYRTNLTRDVQIAMVQTERRKVLDNQDRELHEGKFVIVDEAHLNAQGATLEILRQHAERGDFVLGMTATPAAIGHFYQHLIIGCTTREALGDKSILPARCYTIEEPDRKWVKRVATGEEEVDGKRRKQWSQMIVGRVYDHWCLLNPEHRPTILFAPGVPESLWFAQWLHRRGVNAAHIDAKGVWHNGEQFSGDLAKQDVIGMLREGKLEILCNRWVLREAIDVPCVYHGILATRFGGESTFLQAVGRILRNHPSLPGHVILQDHGGNFLDHGSPNQDRDWQLDDTNEVLFYERKERYRNEVEAEPIICPQCFYLRRTGNVCPQCGHVAVGRRRRVLQTDGTLRTYEGKKYKRLPVAPPNQEKLWKSCYWGAYKDGKRSMAQAMAWFGQRCYERTGRFMRPDPTWEFTPLYLSDHKLPVSMIARARLQHGRSYAT